MLRNLFAVYVFAAWLLQLLLTGWLLAIALLVLPRTAFLPIVRAWLGVAFAIAGVKVRGVGVDQVDWSRPSVFMANHESLLDHLALALVVKEPIVGIEKQENFKIPIYGALVRAWGNIPIDRKNPRRAHETLRETAEAIRNGASIVVMPEGTRTRTGEMNPFKKGGFHLAVDAGCPIVPFTINGAYELSPGDDWRIRPGTMELVFGEAIPTEGYSKDDLDPLIERVRAAIVSKKRAVPAEAPAEA